MKLRMLRSNKGMTMVEVTIVVVLLSAVMVCTLSVLVTMLNMWSKGASGTTANTYASIAMRKLVLDMEEGKTAVLGSTWTDTATGVVYGKRLVVTFPYQVTSTSDYSKTGSGNVVTYYLSGATGTESTGTFLWKSVGTTKTKLAENVELQSLKFTVTNGRLIRISLVGFDREGAAYSPNLIQQSVKLRNS